MSADKDGPRDWDKELADIDKLIASGGSAPAKDAQARGRAGAQGGAAPVRASAPAAATGGGRLAAMRHTPLFTWIRLVLAIGLGLGMTQWPYTHGCGLPLYGYLGGVAVVILASFWTIVSSWKSRSGFAHFLSIALLVWGFALAAREVLPRIGYARQRASWECSPPPAQVSPAVSPAVPAPPK